MKRVFLASLMALAIIGTSCKGKQKSAETTENKKVEVKVTPAEIGRINETVEFTATIDPLQKNNIAPAMVVRIEDITVDVGDKVKKNQVLVTMDPTQYLQSEVQYRTLQNDFDRTKALYEAGGVSKQQLDQLESQLLVAKTSSEMLHKNVSLKSPINGIVTGRYYDAGDMFSMSPSQTTGVAAVLTVMQIDKLKVIVNISEQFFTRIKTGIAVDIFCDLFPGEKFNGKVSLVYPAIETSTRTFATEIEIPNAAGKLRPGMFSRAVINFGEKDGVLIPDVSIQKQQGSNDKFVFVVNGDVVSKVLVKVGKRVGNKMEITEGLTGNETIVIAGASKLDEGSHITVIQ